MSAYILCQIPRAQTPFYLDIIGTNVYSLEELSWFFQHNSCLIDESILNEDLCLWLSRELGLADLGNKMLELLRKQQYSVRELVNLVYKEINYLSHEEMKQFDREMEELEQMSPLHLLKRKGDCLMANEMYAGALGQYRLITEQDQPDETDAFLAGVYHNAGCAYSYLFQMEEALDCFRKAYDLTKSREDLKIMLFALSNARTQLEYMDTLEKYQVEPDLRREVQERIDQIANSDQPVIREGDIDGMLEQMMGDYHRSTGS